MRRRTTGGRVEAVARLDLESPLQFAGREFPYLELTSFFFFFRFRWEIFQLDVSANAALHQLDGAAVFLARQSGRQRNQPLEYFGQRSRHVVLHAK